MIERILHLDNMVGPASYGMTDTMGRMHSEAQFAGSSSVPVDVEIMVQLFRTTVLLLKITRSRGRACR